jgi:hypothetical protein
MPAAGPDRDHLDSVGLAFRGAEAIDDAVALRPLARHVEAEPAAAFEIAAYQAGAERLADPALAGQVADRLECRFDKLFIEL